MDDLDAEDAPAQPMAHAMIKLDTAKNFIRECKPLQRTRALP